MGEPTGASVEAFGEIRFLELPASGAKVSYSTKHFRSPIASGPIVPDILVEPSSKDIFSGRDPVLEAIPR